MRNLTAIFVCFILAISLLTACSSHSSRRYDDRSYSQHRIHKAPRHNEQYGRVSSIEILTVESHNTGGGAILGAIIGGVAGHQMGGGGRGRDVTTGVGAIGGAIAGNHIERRNRRDSEIYRVTVNFDNGRLQQFDYREVDDLQVGDRVKVENGQIYQM